MKPVINIIGRYIILILCILSCNKEEPGKQTGSLFFGDTTELSNASGRNCTLKINVKWNNSVWEINEIAGNDGSFIESIEPASGGTVGGHGITEVKITLKKNESGKTRNTSIGISAIEGYRPQKAPQAIITQSAFIPSDIHNPRLKVDWTGTAKLETGYANPLIDFNYTADPTAIEHEGRLYVYATNDQQQCDEKGPDSENTYGAIKSIAMLSTVDMVNWTWHGTINVAGIAPWIHASWAPSVVSRVEEDGLTHFYMYFSNSGAGTGVLTSTSPTGPWTSPLDKSLLDSSTPGTENCPWIFDPGALIDPDGNAWVTFGSSGGLIVRLGKDMVSIDSEVKRLPTYFHFEANELNYINGTYVYTYNTDWEDHSDWHLDVAPPTTCSMCYMTTKTPLDTESWTYRDNYFVNPGHHGFDFGNNHTHLHKFRGKWYIFYHTMSLRHYLGASGGFRNVCVDEIYVNEEEVIISPGRATKEGVSQIGTVNPFEEQQIEMTAGTKDVIFAPYGDLGNMTASSSSTGCILVKGVEFDRKAARLEITTEGSGRIEIRTENPEGKVMAIVETDNSNMATTISDIASSYEGVTDLCFLFEGKNLKIDSWRFR